jgi:hypothetical protein
VALPLPAAALQVDSPEGHQSDSFYFVDDQLVMHNKAKYTYC